MASNFIMASKKNYLVENAHQLNQLRHIKMPARISVMETGNSHTGIHLFSTHRSCVSTTEAKIRSKANILCSDLSEANNNLKHYSVLETWMLLVVNPQIQNSFNYLNFFLKSSLNMGKLGVHSKTV